MIYCVETKYDSRCCRAGAAWQRAVVFSGTALRGRDGREPFGKLRVFRVGLRACERSLDMSAKQRVVSCNLGHCN